MIEWKTVKLGDVCKFQNGFAFKSKDFVSCGNINIIKIKELKNGFVIFTNDTSKIINSECYRQYLVKENDVLIALTGDPVSKNNPLSWVGRVALYNKAQVSLLNQRVAKFLPNKKELDLKFIYYFFRDFNNFFDLAQKATGSASQANISTKALGNVIFSLPPLDVQRKIAGILGALDDKIEVLREQNKTLEQMAQAVFQSWFVDFDIVRAKAAGLPAADVCKKYHITPDIYDLFPSAFSADNLPLGWEKKKLSDLLTNVKVTIKPSKETISKPYVPIDCISSECLTLYDSKSGNEAQSSLISFRKKDILFGAMRVYFHKVCIAPYEGTTRSTVFVLRPQNKYDLSFSLLSIFQKNCIDFANMNSKGTTIILLPNW